MKKTLLLFIVFIFIFNLIIPPCMVSGNESEPPVSIGSPAITSKTERAGVPGTTPEEYAISLFSMDRYLVDISNQIYRNILKMNPQMFLLTDEGICNTNPWDSMTGEELEWVRKRTKEVLKDELTVDEKILTAAEYVAKNVGYDYDYINHSNQTTEDYEKINHNAYDVLNKGSAVCYGYSATVCSMLQISGIPCIMIFSPSHAWNMAYNGNRWILFDTTWMSNSRYEYGILEKSDEIKYSRFDFSIEWANSDYYHLIEEADYTEYNNGIYKFPIESATLEWFVIPDNITTIGDYAFFEGNDITIFCDAKLKKIGYAAFYECKNFKGELDLSEAETIGEAAFYDCENISRVIFGNSLETVSTWAFANCKSMKGVAALSNVEILGSYAFANCSGITGIILSNKLETLSKNAFVNCDGCKDIVWPKSLMYIEDNALYYMPSLQNIYYYGSQSDWNMIKFSLPLYHVERANKIYNYKPSISVSKGLDDTFTLEYQGIPNGEILIVSEYRDEKLVSVNVFTLEKELQLSSDNSQSKTMKFMVFEDMKTLCPKVKSVETEK